MRLTVSRHCWMVSPCSIAYSTIVRSCLSRVGCLARVVVLGCWVRVLVIVWCSCSRVDEGLLRVQTAPLFIQSIEPTIIIVEPDYNYLFMIIKRGICKITSKTYLNTIYCVFRQIILQNVQFCKRLIRLRFLSCTEKISIHWLICIKNLLLHPMTDEHRDIILSIQ